MLYKRGNVWWYEFTFGGLRVRESSGTDSKTIARQVQLKRRRDLELSVSGVKRDRPLRFCEATKQWLATTTALSALGLRYYRQYLRKLDAEFGNRLVSELTPVDVADLQRLRQEQGLSGRQINAEVGTLRALLRYHGQWSQISGRIRMLRQSAEAGRALSVDEARQLLAAIFGSRSAALYPFFLLSLDAGLRPSESRSLRRSNVRARWSGQNITEAEVFIGRSKTEAGTGRIVPLTRRAGDALASWILRFPDAGPDAYLFPFHRVAVAGNARQPMIYDLQLDRPMSASSYKTAFETARRRSGVRCRFYDARHTFITRLAENPVISEETIRQLAGHVSQRMLSRYAHIRAKARRDAIATLEPEAHGTEDDSPQNPPQCGSDGAPGGLANEEKSQSNQGVVLGSPGRIRTSDPTVNSRLLYRLSYRGVPNVITYPGCARGSRIKLRELVRGGVARCSARPGVTLCRRPRHPPRPSYASRSESSRSIFPRDRATRAAPLRMPSA
jgi:integrase